MIKLIKCLFCLLYAINVAYAAGSTDHESTSDWYSRDGAHGVKLHVELFVSSTCPHCHKADDFFQQLAKRTPWLVVDRFAINEDKEALDAFYQRLQQLGSMNFAVPTIMFCQSRWLGFDSAETTGKQLMQALRFCYQRIQQDGQLSPMVVNTLKQWSGTSPIDVQVNLNQASSLTVSTLILAALMEAYSPCAVFCFSLFLAFIWLYPHSRWTQWWSGLLFMLTLGLIHSLHYVFTLAYQRWLVYAQSWSLLAAGLLFLYLFYYLRHRHQGDNQSSTWWGYVVLAVSSVAVYLNQEMCAYSVGATFQQWLSAQVLTPAVFALCQLVYLVFYLSSLALLLGFFLMFGTHPRRVLSSAACVILLTTALLLVIYPSGLANVSLSIVVLVLSLLVGWLIVQRENRLAR